MSKEHTGLPNTPEEIRAFIGKSFSSLRFGQDNEQPHENDTYTLTAHDLISAFQWSEIDAPVSAEPLGMSLEIRTLGNYGAAFDLPGNRRAYTYDHQPGNVEASRLGSACLQAASASAGDTIDRGLGLLKELQAQGFGVFDTDTARWHAAPVAAQVSKMPDAARIALDSLDADAVYLLSRVKQETLSIHDAAQLIRQRIEAARTAIDSPAATQPDITQQTLDDVKAGIPARDAEIEALRKEIDTLRAQQEADKVDEERKNTDVIRMLCETLDLARTCHSAMLMSDPPQEMWKARGVDQAIGKALHAADYHRMIGEAHDAARKEQA